MLKDRLWTRRINTKAEIAMFRENQIKKRMVKHGKTTEWYIWKEKSTFQTTKRFESKFYKKIMNQQI